MEDILLSPKQYRALMERLNSITDDVGTMKSKTVPQPDVLDSHELKRLLQVTDRTLRRWRSRGTLPYFFIGSKIYYRGEELLGRFRLQPQPVGESRIPLVGDPAQPPDHPFPSADEGREVPGTPSCVRCPLFLLLQTQENPDPP